MDVEYVGPPKSTGNPPISYIYHSYGATPPDMLKEMVPSVPSEQEVGVVLTFVMARLWADTEVIENARNRISNMEYLYAFIETQIRAVPK
jgi:hypothetical protein